MITENKIYFNRLEVAELLTTKGLKTSHRTLAKMASTSSNGIPYRIWGTRRVVYHIDDINEYIERNLSKPIANTNERITTNKNQAS
jgi:hypothetical protein